MNGIYDQKRLKNYEFEGMYALVIYEMQHKGKGDVLGFYRAICSDFPQEWHFTLPGAKSNALPLSKAVGIKAVLKDPQNFNIYH